jgi:hypothetical protein
MELYYLSSVSFSETKQEIYAEFKGHSAVVTRFNFSPMAFFSKDISVEVVQKFLLDLGFKNFLINPPLTPQNILSEINPLDLEHLKNLREKNSLPQNKFNVITAISQNELKKISNALISLLGFKIIVVEPERSFLISRDWNYFDSFVFKNDIPIKQNFSVPNFKQVTGISFEDAQSLSPERAEQLIELMVLSSFLKKAPSLIPDSSQERAELFLENIFYSEAQPIFFESSETTFLSYSQPPWAEFEKLSSIDFTLFWPRIFTNNFFNLDSSQCSCCAPVSNNTISQKNLLPSTKIEVIPLSDFFYDSSSKNFADEFHSINSFKIEREARMKENFLKKPPIGPLTANTKIKIPIHDALRLIESGQVTLGNEHSFKWFCIKNESFFSTQLKKYLGLLDFVEDELKKENYSLSSSNSKNFFNPLKPTLEQIFLTQKESLLSSVLAETTFNLLSKRSKFYSSQLAEKILGIQEHVLSSFEEFSEKKGYRIIHSDSRNAFIKGHSCLDLTKSFSQEKGLPTPEIKAFLSNSRPKR